MPEAISLASAAASKKLGSSIVTDLYELAKAKVRARTNKRQFEISGQKLCKRVVELRKVKTILQPGRAVDLATFFLPPSAMIDGRKQILTQIGDIILPGILLITGIVGMGKSTLLRYLAFVDFQLNRRIPVFVELRKLKKDQTLKDQIAGELENLGFKIDQDTLQFLMEEHKIALFLDAFDELPNGRESAIEQEIEDIARQYDSLTIVVTSRPNHPLEYNFLTSVLPLCELTGNDYQIALRKMSSKEDDIDSLISEISKTKGNLVDMLRTPLMVALLLARYRITHIIPDTRISFYKSLFGLLAENHDAAKGSYRRHRKSGMNDRALLEFFNGFAFVTRKRGISTIEHLDSILFGKEAMGLCSAKGDPDEALEDIIKITCLLLRDSAEIRFIHTSVQEYHAALCIKMQSDEIAQKFYFSMRENWNLWREELIFLAQIDPFRYEKYLNLPELSRMFSGCLDPWDYKQFILNVFGGDRISVMAGRRRISEYRWGTRESWPVYYQLSEGRNSFIRHWHMYNFSDEDLELLQNGKDRSFSTIGDLVCHPSLTPSLARLFERISLSFRSTLLKSKDFVERGEAKLNIFNF